MSYYFCLAMEDVLVEVNGAKDIACTQVNTISGGVNKGEIVEITISLNRTDELDERIELNERVMKVYVSDGTFI